MESYEENKPLNEEKLQSKHQYKAQEKVMLIGSFYGRSNKSY